MSFFDKYGINRAAVINHYISMMDLWGTRAMLSDENKTVSMVARYRLEKDKNNKESIIDTFGKNILNRAIEYTPYEDDDMHTKKHPNETHLRDAYEYQKIEKIFSDMYIYDIYIVNKNTYAAAVHEDFRANHESPTRADYLRSAAIEVSAEYGNPFDIYIKIGPENVELFITSSSINTKNINDSYLIDVEVTDETIINTDTGEELSRKDKKSIEGLAEQLGNSFLNNYNIKSTKRILGAGFKKLVSGTDTYNEMMKNIEDERKHREYMENMQVDYSDDTYYSQFED